MMSEVLKPWYRTSVLYHIYPLSFADSNGDGYGDLRGIRQHLNYLAGHEESLGIGAIWLSPVYVSPMQDWGYDVADHMAIDPRFGTMADFEALLRDVHARGMKLLMDFVPNHTASIHPWFLESRQGRQSSKRDWYIWADPAADGGVPNNWLSYFGGPAWTLDEASGQYYLHSFLPSQPDLNWRNPEVREAMLGVLRFWLDKGVDGFRTDAVYGLLKDPQLRDDPPNPSYRAGISDPADQLLRVHSAGQSSLAEVIGAFCEVLAEHNGTYLLSEAYLNIPELHQLYQACRKHPVHAPFNFNLMSLSWGASYYRNFIDEYERSLGPEDWPNYVLGNHDRHRLVSRVGPARAKLLGLLQLTLRGLPVVYYGEELGMSDVQITTKQVRDPWEMRVPNMGLGRDGARTPMPWGADDDSFTSGVPWLPMGRKAAQVNVATLEKQPDSTLAMYRHLIHLRSMSPALQEGDYRSLPEMNPYVFAFVRETEHQRFLVTLNFDDARQSFVMPGKIGTWIAGTHEVDGDGQVPVGGRITLEPYEGRVYELAWGGKHEASI